MSKETGIARRDVLKTLGTVPLAIFAPVLAEAAGRETLYFSCGENNNLYRVASACGIACSRHESPEEAVTRAREGSGVLILAEDYPRQTTRIKPSVYVTAAKKRLRVYAEFTSAIPGLSVGKPQQVAKGRYHNILDRAVVDTDAFGPSLKRMRILALHNCTYVPVEFAKAELVLARVAGFDYAVYGLPEKGVHPILFRHPSRNILVVTTKLSGFVEGRYAPSSAWPYVWRWVFDWLSNSRKSDLLHWTPSVHPMSRRGQPLPADAELGAFRKGAAWFSNAKLFVAPSWKAKATEYATSPHPRQRPAPSWPLGNGSDGMLEGFSSLIDWNGKQPVGWNRRADCAGETAMTMAFSGVISGKGKDRQIASNLNNFIYFNSVLTEGPRADPQSPSYGLLGWTLPQAPGTYYGDDNARSMLGSMAAAGLLKTNRWDEKILRCLLANLRTTGVYGFRPDSLTEKELQKFGWRHFYDLKFINYHPHFEAYPWACFLRAYEKTHYAPFLERARTGIRMTMAAYPNDWRWTNGFQQERARMLLALAWLIRVEDTSEHRGWLKRIAGDLLSFQTPSGCIREVLGPPRKSSIPPPKSNAQYGTSEASLLQKNGDPVCDLLYTMNFAFLGLHEAAEATQDESYKSAEDKLAGFFCRIQVQSKKHPELAGGWFRAFDYRRWDYWASGSDWGWGPWSIESGWTMTWITSVLGMRNLRTSLWDVTGRSDLGAHARRLIKVMFS